MATKITKAYVESFIKACALGSQSHPDIQKDLTPYISPLYVQDRGGVKSNYLETVEHLSKIRAVIESLDVTMEDLVVDAKERRFASRHVAVVKKKGEDQLVKWQIALFGEFNDEGRFTKIYEMAKEIK
jgi:hypothetical protein